MDKINKQLMRKMMTKKQYRKEMQKGRSMVSIGKRLGTQTIATGRTYCRSAVKREERNLYDKVIEGT